MRVSICIATWNRCELLSATLARLCELKIPDDVHWEVVVVDNNSSDRTPRVVEGFVDRLPLRFVFEGNQGVSHAKNRAHAEATGELILWTDDDVLVDQEWLVEGVRCANRFPAAGAFGGAVEPWFPIEPDEMLSEAFPLLRAGFCATAPDLAEGPCNSSVTIYGANMAFRVEAVRGLRFDVTLGPKGDYMGAREDEQFIDDVRRSGYDVVFCPSMRVRHYVDPSRMTEQYLLRLYRDRTESFVRRCGTPAGRRVMGAPVWAWRRIGEEWMKMHAARLMGARLRRLVAAREYSRAIGLVRGARKFGHMPTGTQDARSRP